MPLRGPVLGVLPRNRGSWGQPAPGWGVSAPFPTVCPAVPVSPTGGACCCWGWNEHGMCGDGAGADVWAPRPVQALRSSPALLVGCGAGHSLALCQLPAPPCTGPSPDAPEDADSQEAVDKERNWKERQPETSLTGPEMEGL